MNSSLVINTITGVLEDNYELELDKELIQKLSHMIDNLNQDSISSWSCVFVYLKELRRLIDDQVSLNGDEKHNKLRLTIPAVSTLDKIENIMGKNGNNGVNLNVKDICRGAKNRVLPFGRDDISDELLTEITRFVLFMGLLVPTLQEWGQERMSRQNDGNDFKQMICVFAWWTSARPRDDKPNILEKVKRVCDKGALIIKILLHLNSTLHLQLTDDFISGFDGKMTEKEIVNLKKSPDNPDIRISKFWIGYIDSRVRVTTTTSNEDIKILKRPLPNTTPSLPHKKRLQQRLRLVELNKKEKDSIENCFCGTDYDHYNPSDYDPSEFYAQMRSLCD